jgi:DNA repair photolyase
VKHIPAANPPVRFETRRTDYFDTAPPVGMVVYEDSSKSILSKNDSPDVGFRWSVNPYRGCLHACAYCYARPSHEYLSLGSGTDFDRKILVKPRAPELLREAFERRSWSGELILFSGNTDCYQPLEAEWQLTRRCLEVCVEYGNPVHIITKAALIERDMDVLSALQERASVGISVSVPFWDERTARAIEPYAPSPQRRMRTVGRLSQRGFEVTVNVAPLIPGLSDRDVPSILEAAAAAGAKRAALIPLRLPGAVKEVFAERIRAAVPLTADKILARTREMRGGKLHESRFGLRMTGEGEYFGAIEALFKSTARRLGLNDSDCSGPLPETFRRPKRGQLGLFDS